MRRYFRKVSTYPGRGSSSTSSSGYILLPIPQADLPNASGTVNNPAEMIREVSTATNRPANTPKVTRTYARFDPSTAEHLMWTRKAEANWGTPVYVDLEWKSATGTTNAVQWKAAIAPEVPGTTDDDIAIFNAAVLGSGQTCATAQGKSKQLTLTVSATGVAADRQYTVMIGRHATGAADTHASDAILMHARLRYTPTATA